MPTEITKLKNGLFVASVLMPDVDTVSFTAWVNVGTRYETPEINGISHFLEHMIFKGTKKRTALQIAEEFDAVGGYMNAYTSRESTVYYAKVTKEHSLLAVDILSDMLLNSTMDEKELALEKGVVIQEIAQSFDAPDDIIFDYHQQTAFPNQALGWPVLGSKENINSLNRKHLLDFTNHYYQPERMVFSAAGNIKHEEFVKLVEEFFTADTRPGEIAPQEAGYTGGECRKPRDLEQLHLLLGFNGVSFKGDDYYVMQLISAILSSGMSSRLFQEVREKRGLAYSVQTYASTYLDGGLFSVYAGTSEEKAPELIEVICKELVALTGKIAEKEIIRAKAQIKSSILMDRESTTSRAEEIARQLAWYGKYTSGREIISKIESITIAEINAVAKKIFIANKPTITSLGAIKNVPEYDDLLKAIGG